MINSLQPSPPTPTMAKEIEIWWPMPNRLSNQSQFSEIDIIHRSLFTSSEKEPAMTIAVTDKPASTVSKPATSATTSVVSLSLDAETYLWFEAKAAEDDRTLSKFIARHLRAYVLAEQKKKQENDKF